METDTICAVSTALGVGAISIIRCSGQDSIKIVNKMFDGKNLEEVPSHTIHYGFIKDENGEKIDEVLISVMKSPKTFTTEDVVEINCHGGISTTNKVLELLLTNGCRLATRGEFTKRAFLNGRIDLLEAEAIGDLINSETESSRKMAINQITGNLSLLIENARKDILDLLANIAVNIDYPEYEDAEIITHDLLKQKLIPIKKKLENLLEESKNGKIIKEGINVSIIGRPNVGKSSILNHLLNENKAIVTNIAGTTRDIVEGEIILKGIKLNLTDTAGIRKTDNIVEQIGVEKSKEILKNTDLVILVLNSSENLTEEDEYLLNLTKNKKRIILLNKTDLPTKLEIKEEYILGNTTSPNGLDLLKNKICEMFNLEEINSKNLTFLSNARQISLVKQCVNLIDNIIITIDTEIPIDMLEIDIKSTFDLLGEIIGKTYKEELIDELFSKYCLGK